MVKRHNRRGCIEGHRITPGVVVDSIGVRIESKEKSVAGIKSDDTKNREYVMNTLIDNISKGMTEDEALDLMMQNDVVKEFEYLQKNGCDIKECFRNWIRGFSKRRGKDFTK